MKGSEKINTWLWKRPFIAIICQWASWQLASEFVQGWIWGCRSPWVILWSEREWSTGVGAVRGDLWLISTSADIAYIFAVLTASLMRSPTHAHPLTRLTSYYICHTDISFICMYLQVDSLYCANCLENMPSSEARLKKNRCGSCFDCPSCFHTLSTRATSIQTKHASAKEEPKTDAKPDPKVDSKAPKKMYYLSCFNCRWTSRDVGMPDQPVGEYLFISRILMMNLIPDALFVQTVQ